MTAIMSILLLMVGSISIIGATHVATASQIGKLCVFFACGNANITGGTTSSGGGGGGGGQPTPTTGTIIVTKAVKGCAAGEACPLPESFTIKIMGTNPSPSTVNDDGSGTKVTIDPGDFAVAEAPT